MPYAYIAVPNECFIFPHKIETHCFYRCLCQPVLDHSQTGRKETNVYGSLQTNNTNEFLTVWKTIKQNCSRHFVCTLTCAYTFLCVFYGRWIKNLFYKLIKNSDYQVRRRLYVKFFVCHPIFILLAADRDTPIKRTLYVKSVHDLYRSICKTWATINGDKVNNVCNYENATPSLPFSLYLSLSRSVQWLFPLDLVASHQKKMLNIGSRTRFLSQMKLYFIVHIDRRTFHLQLPKRWQFESLNEKTETWCWVSIVWLHCGWDRHWQWPPRQISLTLVNDKSTRSLVAIYN